jgi:hypothetical protein
MSVRNLLPSWLGGRRTDPYEEALRARATRLARYIAMLQKERAQVAALLAKRAGEISALCAECRRRLVLVHSWGLFDLLETFYRQSVMLMRRAYLRAAADAAFGAALDEQLASAEKLRARAAREADERAEELASPAGRLGAAPPRVAADAEGSLDLDAFCAPAASVRRASPSLPRLRARIDTLTRELLALDEVLRGLAGELAEPPPAARAAALARAVAAEAAAAAEEAAAAAAVAGAVEAARGAGVPVRAAAGGALALLAGGGGGGGSSGGSGGSGAPSGGGGAAGEEAAAALLLCGALPPLGARARAALSRAAAALPPPAAAALAAAAATIAAAAAAACERRRAGAARARDFERLLCDQR